MDSTEAAPVSSPQRRRVALVVALALAGLLLGVLAVLMAALGMQAQARAEAERILVPDRVQVLSAVWLKQDRFQVRVRLSRVDGAPLRGLHGIRLTDPAPDGSGFLSDYPATQMAAPDGTLAAVEVVARQGLVRSPGGPLRLEVSGWTAIPKSNRSALERFLFGPDLPRVPALRYPLAGGALTLPAPKATPATKSSRALAVCKKMPAGTAKR